MPKLASKKECTGCMACVDECPKSALSFNLADDGHIYPALNIGECVNCNLCEVVCPVVSKFNYRQSPYSKGYAAWSINDNIRSKSATAGAFAAMAQYFLLQGGIVYGAAMIDGLHVKHIKVDKLDDLYRLQGSKYSQSNASGIYRDVWANLKIGKEVLFSGTGCQIAGLYSYLKNKCYVGELITVDLICGGVPSYLLIRKFVESEPITVKKILQFRTKENGWSPNGFRYNLKIEDINGRVHDYTNKRNLITYGFACEMTNRYSCYHCNFSGLNRLSDFTIGDFWGIKDYNEQHKNGVSAVIAHSSKALMFLNKIDKLLILKEVDVSDILEHNKRLGNFEDKRGSLPERKYLACFFSHLSYKNLRRIYALDFSNYSPWIFLKIYRYLITKFL